MGMESGRVYVGIRLFIHAHFSGISEKVSKLLEVNPSKSVIYIATVLDGIFQLSGSSTILPKSGFSRRGKGA